MQDGPVRRICGGRCGEIVTGLMIMNEQGIGNRVTLVVGSHQEGIALTQQCFIAEAVFKSLAGKIQRGLQEAIRTLPSGQFDVAGRQGFELQITPSPVNQATVALADVPVQGVLRQGEIDQLRLLNRGSRTAFQQHLCNG